MTKEIAKRARVWSLLMSLCLSVGAGIQWGIGWTFILLPIWYMAFGLMWATIWHLASLKKDDK